MNLLTLFLFALAIILSEGQLSIVCPPVLEIKDLNFSQKVSCSDEDRNEVNCQLSALGLPFWMIL